ncbi:MAG TPA: MoaD/ThiS family protein [Terriglobales bacterium]|nr:MoaD/ThiS family protein [Terriglobales bacterium]
MPCTVHIPTPLQRFTDGAQSVACEAGTLPALLQELGTRFPALRDRLCEPDGRPRRFFNVYVNDEDIRFLGGNAYQFAGGDEVLILPSIAGGVGGRAH